MQKMLQKPLSWLGRAILKELLEPLNEIKDTQREQGEEIKKLHEKIERLHKADPIVEECDLASLDNQICTLIASCRKKGYTTADERRRCSRMHKAYEGRKGNHGEKSEYAIFCRLPTEEEFFRMKGV